VFLCGSFLGPVFEKDKKYSSELFTQMGYSQAVFIIENPGKARDEFEVYRAGLLGSLRAYESADDPPCHGPCLRTVRASPARG
jgi:hypothetical protein